MSFDGCKDSITEQYLNLCFSYVYLDGLTCGIDVVAILSLEMQGRTRTHQERSLRIKNRTILMQIIANNENANRTNFHRTRTDNVTYISIRTRTQISY